MLYRSFAVIGALLMASPAIAQIPAADNKFHVSLTYLHIFVPGMFDQESGDLVHLQSHQYSVVGLRSGYDFIPYLGVEAEAGFGVGSSTINVSGGGLQIPVIAKTKFIVGGFAKVQYPVGDALFMHARVGGVHIKSEGSALGFSNSGTDQELAYGAGFEVRLTNILGFRADWTGYGTESPRVQSASASVVARF